MTYYSRLRKALEGACTLPLNHNSKYVLFSDCHRGIGNTNDNFLKNHTLYIAALQYYFRNGFTYIELGDGDELWENRRMKHIAETHSEIFCLHSLFREQNRLYLLYGNHDIVRKDLYEGILLRSAAPPHSGHKDIFLTHGHQAELLNSTFWPLSRFLVRYLWSPLEYLGIPDPTSAAKNHTRKEKTEKRLHRFAEQEGLLIIAGHTHRPYLSESDPYYCNCGSCVHPFSITCLELEHLRLRLVKWSLTTGSDMGLRISREVLSGPVMPA